MKKWASKESRKQAYEWAVAYSNGLNSIANAGVEKLQITKEQLDRVFTHPHECFE